MHQNKLTSKLVKRTNLFLLLMLIFKSTGASLLAISPITLVLLIVLCLHLFLRRRLSFDKLFINFTFFYIGITFIYLLQFGTIDYMLTGYFYLKFFYAYLTVKLVGRAFFNYYEKIVYYGALISLFMFLFQILFYEQVLYFVSYLQNNISFFYYDNDDHYSIFFFTIEARASQFRNTGFAWEPKGFANFLALAIFINLCRNKLNFKNKKMYVFLLALITTFSTTGYIIVFVFFSLFLIYNSTIKLKIFIAPFFIFSLYFLFQLQFMYDKIEKEVTTKGNYERILTTDRDDRETFSLGRIGSFIVDFKDFVKKPIIGYGMQREERTQHPWVKLVRVNGISDILASFGITGLIFFLFYYNKFYDSIVQRHP